MPRKTLRETIRALREQGYSELEIQLGRQHQERQRANGVHPLPLDSCVTGIAPKAQAMRNNFRDRQLAGKSDLDQAAVLLGRAALAQNSPLSAARLHSVSQTVREIYKQEQIEFDFLCGGNMSTGHKYQDAIIARLRQSGATLAKQHQALAVLWIICRHLVWQRYECSKTAAELCDITGIKSSHMPATLDLLEAVGAIVRVKRGRAKLITVTPEGAYYGNVNNHVEAVKRYKLEVIDGGKAGE
jgi:DNA-binding MarR family transcriptional regulator